MQSVCRIQLSDMPVGWVPCYFMIIQVDAFTPKWHDSNRSEYCKCQKWLQKDEWYAKGLVQEKLKNAVQCQHKIFIGKRDYAIMLTAIQTGLRAVDIVNLKRQDIDWETMKSALFSKTGHPLNLPRVWDWGMRIADYLLNGRPKCDIPLFMWQSSVPP